MLLHGRALQSCLELTICQRKADKLLTRRCSTIIPQRSPTAWKHQECGQNDQKGAACRRHNKKSTQGIRFPAKVDRLRHPNLSFSKIKESTRGTWFLPMKR
ncbi:uncharacterized protein LOC144207667 [Stigmatopora nigra]